jgi:hypothetical protein
MAEDRADAQMSGPGSQTNFGAVQERVRHFEEKLEDLVDSVKDTNLAVQRLAETVSEAGKTKWGILIAGATLFCIATGAVWTVSISPISERITDLRAQERLDMQHIEDEIKNKADSAVIDKTIDKLDLRIEQLNKNLGFKK